VPAPSRRPPHSCENHPTHPGAGVGLGLGDLSPFLSGATITVSASVAVGDFPDPECTGGTSGCWVIGPEPFIHVYGPNGF
jgi:hypothetical protein